MSTASGPDSPNEMGSNVPLPGQQSSESSSKSQLHEVKISSSKLRAGAGDRQSAGNLIKSELLSVAGDSITNEGQAIIERFVDNADKGFISVMPMICKGMNCPYIGSCPINQAKGALPVGKRCPVEDTIAILHVKKHLAALGIDNIDDSTHSFDMDMLFELAGLELIRWRCGAELSKNPNLMYSQPAFATQDGDVEYQDIVHPIIEVLDKTGKHISKLREALVATRKAQLEAGQVVQDVSQRAAELRAQAEKLRKQRMEKINNSTKDADFTVKEEDDGRDK